MIEQILGWIGTALFFYGVWALARKNIWGFFANSLANILYMAQGILMKNWPLVACSIGLFIINIYGVREWRRIKTILPKLLIEFFTILDSVEETDSGTRFHPVTIDSCRVMKTKRLGELFSKMKDIIKYKGNNNV